MKTLYRIYCRIFGHKFPKKLMDARCDSLPSSRGFGLSVRCEHDCIRCGFTKEFRTKWD